MVLLSMLLAHSLACCLPSPSHAGPVSHAAGPLPRMLPLSLACCWPSHVLARVDRLFKLKSIVRVRKSISILNVTCPLIFHGVGNYD